MRLLIFGLLSACCYAQQPILHTHGTYNAASYAPFGLPNAAIARGSIFAIFGENLGPAQSPSLAFPLSTTLGGVSVNVTQNGTVTQCFPIYVSATQVNAVMPSTVTAGLATLRLMYQSGKSNAITIQIANVSPGVFAISSGGYGPAVVQNYVSGSNQPINSLVQPAAPGQVVTIWATGLGPVTFPDNVAPTAGNVAATVTVTIGGQQASVAYSGRSPCCSGVDQIVATVPANAAMGCWVPLTVNAGGTVSNTTTMAVAAPGAASCNDPGNPLSTLVQTPGTQAFIHIGRSDIIENIQSGTPSQEILDKFYSRFFTRPNSPYNFDPYMSLPPAGTCLANQTAGDVGAGAPLRGVLPPAASLSQPNQSYNNGTQVLQLSPAGADYSTSLGGTINGNATGMNLLGANGSYTAGPGGANQTVIPLAAEAAPAWSRPSSIIVILRNAPLTLPFTSGDSAAPTVIQIQAYSAATNSTVLIECMAAPGTNSFTISADTLSNLPASYAIADGSYTNLFIGSFALNRAASFSSSLVSNGGTGAFELGGTDGDDSMKTQFALGFLLFALPLLSQPQPSQGVLYLDQNGNVDNISFPEDDSGDFQLYYTFQYVNGVKTLTYSVESCNPPLNVELFLNAGFLGLTKNPCLPIRQGASYNFSAVFQLVLELKDWANGQPNRVVYQNVLARARENLQPGGGNACSGDPTACRSTGSLDDFPGRPQRKHFAIRPGDRHSHQPGFSAADRDRSARHPPIFDVAPE